MSKNNVSILPKYECMKIDKTFLTVLCAIVLFLLVSALSVYFYVTRHYPSYIVQANFKFTPYTGDRLSKSIHDFLPNDSLKRTNMTEYKSRVHQAYALHRKHVYDTLKSHASKIQKQFVNKLESLDIVDYDSFWLDNRYILYCVTRIPQGLLFFFSILVEEISYDAINLLKNLNGVVDYSIYYRSKISFKPSANVNSLSGPAFSNHDFIQHPDLPWNISTGKDVSRTARICMSHGSHVLDCF
jgi:hypothetical protein